MNFEEILTKSFVEFIDNRIEKALHALMERSLADKIEEHVCNMLEGSDLSDFFDVESEVQNHLNNEDLGDYLDKSEIQDMVDSAIHDSDVVTSDDVDECVQQALDNQLNDKIKALVLGFANRL